MPTAANMLRDAKRAPERETLAAHRETISTLRQKNYTWREIAEFFRERGMETDHSKLFRFMQRKGKLKMNTYENFFVPSAKDYARVLADLKMIEKDLQVSAVRFEVDIEDVADNRNAPTECVDCDIGNHQS